LSRYRFVYPVEKENTASAIAACEAAWTFYGGVFRVLIPDNTKAIVATPDPLKPVLATAFREYSQARGFVVDPARVRSPQDKGRVENAVKSVRGDCFGGENLVDVESARKHARWWCEEEYGATKHRTTRRFPRRGVFRVSTSSPSSSPRCCRRPRSATTFPSGPSRRWPVTRR
jgi:transposase